MRPQEKAGYRLELAEGGLRRAREAFQRGDYLACISEAQLSVENAAKPFNSRI